MNSILYHVANKRADKRQAVKPGAKKVTLPDVTANLCFVTDEPLTIPSVAHRPPDWSPSGRFFSMTVVAHKRVKSLKIDDVINNVSEVFILKRKLLQNDRRFKKA